MSVSETARKRAARDQAALLALPPDAVLTLPEAARVAAVSARHLAQERALGRGPKCYRLGEKAIRTTLADVLAWVKARAEVSPA
ncbi:MAG: hypothetical protein IT436_04660 [Phycisphaerales bacterium]|nr:hypothetical protein [Phycisphaerales bacterium]